MEDCLAFPWTFSSEVLSSFNDVAFPYVGSRIASVLAACLLPWEVDPSNQMLAGLNLFIRGLEDFACTRTATLDREEGGNLEEIKKGVADGAPRGI